MSALEAILLDLGGTLWRWPRKNPAPTAPGTVSGSSRIPLVAGWLDGDPRRFGLADLVDEVLYASELGRAKPHPAVFLEAARRLGAAPSRASWSGTIYSAMSWAPSGWAWWRSGSATADPSQTLATSGPSAAVDDLADLSALLSRLSD